MKKHKIWNAVCVCRLFTVVMVSKTDCNLEEFFVTEPELRPFLDVTARHRYHGRKNS
jgi:hypothetical protein